MPFPLAHPAAVLPLRTYCPRYLSFPALVIGSLTPDLGYFFGRFRLGEFSHRFFPGIIGFCLPAGFVLVLLICGVRTLLTRVLPTQYREAILPICEWPVGSPMKIAGSLVIGASTHILLDSITHEDGGLVQRLAFLRWPLPCVGSRRLGVYEVLYAGFTFLGVAWLALTYLRWREARNTSGLNQYLMKGSWALLLASGILLIAEASRDPNQSLGIISAGIITVSLVVAFLWGTEKCLGMPGQRRPFSKPTGSAEHPPRLLK